MSKEVDIRLFILSLDQPVVFHGMINEWEVLSWNLEEWSCLFGNNALPFRCGNGECSPKPQWERQCSTEKMTMGQFINILDDKDVKCNKKWFYFDYKYIHQWVPEGAVSNALQSISWTRFGFPEIDADSSTLWVGSKGAHTPCHMDTYGCNLVAQVYGEKQWILFPPEEHIALRASRVPYEESSIYSMWNLSSPPPSKFYETIRNVYILTLRPGDVLFVPRHWWHYVESLSTSVSINTWIPLEEDNFSRIEEALVRYFISHVSNPLQSDLRQFLLNPNEDNITSNNALDLVKASVSQQRENHTLAAESSGSSKKKVRSKRRKLTSTDIKTINFEKPSQATVEDLKALLDGKCTCASSGDHVSKMREFTSKEPCNETINQQKAESELLHSCLVNAFCHPDIIRSIRLKFMKCLHETN